MRHSAHRLGDESLRSLLRTTSAAVVTALLVATLLVAVVFGSVVDSFENQPDLDHTAMVVGDASKSTATLADELQEAMIFPADLSASVARADREIRGFLADAARNKAPAVRDAVEASLAAWSAAEAQIHATVRAGSPEPRQLNADVARLILSGHTAARDLMRVVTIAHQFLTTPSEPGVLVAAIERALRLRHELDAQAGAYLLSLWGFPLEIGEGPADHAEPGSLELSGPLSAHGAVRLAHRPVESERMRLCTAPGDTWVCNASLVRAGVLDVVRSWRAEQTAPLGVAS